jgi:hypothetical protein
VLPCTTRRIKLAQVAQRLHLLGETAAAAAAGAQCKGC